MASEVPQSASSEDLEVAARRDALKKIGRLGVYTSPALLAVLMPGKAQAASVFCPRGECPPR